MKIATRKALEKSIKHWEVNLVDPTKAGISSGSCALCRLFIKNGCKDCPVSTYTSRNQCLGTPYTKAYNAYTAHGSDSPQFRRAALAELRFLESLRPKR